MKYSVDDTKYHFSFNKKHPSTIEVNSGDEIIFKTRDAKNRVVPEDGDVVLPNIPRNRTNPVIGPVFVRGATTNDVLKVTIINIKVGSVGFVQAKKDYGVLKGITDKYIARNLTIKKNLINFSKNIKIPIRPMIGTIGVAPAEGGILSVYPGPHGGNMDNNDIKENSIVYLPIFTEGGLFSIGDIHATMGDGEISTGGVDIDSEVTAKLEVIKNKRITRPIIETKDSIITTGYSNDFYEAVEMVTVEMINILTNGLEISKLEAYWLISMCGDLKVSQSCNSYMDLTLRLVFPKHERYLKWKPFDLSHKN
jgi:amidase